MYIMRYNNFFFTSSPLLQVFLHIPWNYNIYIILATEINVGRFSIIYTQPVV